MADKRIRVVIDLPPEAVLREAAECCVKMAAGGKIMFPEAAQMTALFTYGAAICEALRDEMIELLKEYGADPRNTVPDRREIRRILGRE